MVLSPTVLMCSSQYLKYVPAAFIHVDGPLFCVWVPNSVHIKLLTQSYKSCIRLNFENLNLKYFVCRFTAPRSLKNRRLSFYAYKVLNINLLY